MNLPAIIEAAGALTGVLVNALKQPIQLCIHFTDDFTHVFLVFGKFVFININDQQGAFLIAFNPFILKIVEAF